MGLGGYNDPGGFNDPTDRDDYSGTGGDIINDFALWSNPTDRTLPGVMEDEMSFKEGNGDFSWKAFSYSLLVDGAINAFRYVAHHAKSNPGLKEEVMDRLSDPNDPITQEYTGSGGAERDGVLNSDGTLDFDGSGDSSGDGLLSGKNIRKQGLNRLWDEITTDSPYETGLRELGLTATNTTTDILNQMKSGEFTLPAWMQKLSDKNFGRFTEASSRKGQLPGSTAYGQGVSAFNLSDQESATKYGLGMLGLTAPISQNVFNSMNANKINEYSSLFGGGQGLLDPQKIKTDDPKWWETALDFGSEVYTASSLGGLL